MTKEALIESAGLAITSALAYCQRAGVAPSVTDKLLEAKRDLQKPEGKDKRA